nr:hypothetical protein [Pseudolysinimonas kribbensis]
MVVELLQLGRADASVPEVDRPVGDVGHERRRRSVELQGDVGRVRGAERAAVVRCDVEGDQVAGVETLHRVRTGEGLRGHDVLRRGQGMRREDLLVDDRPGLAGQDVGKALIAGRRQPEHDRPVSCGPDARDTGQQGPRAAGRLDRALPGEAAHDVRGLQPVAVGEAQVRLEAHRVRAVGTESSSRGDVGHEPARARPDGQQVRVDLLGDETPPAPASAAGSSEVTGSAVPTTMPASPRSLRRRIRSRGERSRPRRRGSRERAPDP